MPTSTRKSNRKQGARKFVNKILDKKIPNPNLGFNVYPKVEDNNKRKKKEEKKRKKPK